MASYMNYKDQLHSGDLAAWTIRKLHSLRDLEMRLVRLFTMSEYNHVGVIWVSGSRVFVVEATQPAVRLFPLDKLTPFFHVPLSIEWDESYTDHLFRSIGEPYSVSEAIKSYFTKPTAENRWQCAKYVSEFYNWLGIGEFGFTPSEVVYSALQRSDSGLIYVAEKDRRRANFREPVLPPTDSMTE